MIEPSLILKAYKAGVFPMSEARDDNSVFWVRPEIRGIFAMDNFHIPKSTYRMLKKTPYYVTVNQDFAGTIKGCIEAQSNNRKNTWINHKIQDVFMKLHALKHAHSFETRNNKGDLIGGLYGLAIGGAFFGESMFSNITGASKFALIACHAYLKERYFQLFDTQFSNSHLKLFGCMDISCDAYDLLLKQAIQADVDFLTPLPMQPIILSDYIL
jgi:leucyl/phenylalanyl-tRNA--protein transferase